MPLDTDIAAADALQLERISAQDYRNEVKSLAAVGHQAAVAIENTRLPLISKALFFSAHGEGVHNGAAKCTLVVPQSEAHLISLQVFRFPIARTFCSVTP
jgi:hypothetical protein